MHYQACRVFDDTSCCVSLAWQAPRFSAMIVLVTNHDVVRSGQGPAAMPEPKRQTNFFAGNRHDDARIMTAQVPF
ncbi:hypothetical protein A0U93_07470 [Neoasaia chiangmaiensis]|uniref:Uncharacterized protein n=1 Tax=Neoasaia chiangmaiensis TaxID=320497 RepID=A0A1U9KPR8_9PROT|nr:hypothetical protein A0U93_07470 [Neoasaia chiangmaiensis]